MKYMIYAYNMDKPWKYFTKGNKPATNVIYNLYEITRIAKSMEKEMATHSSILAWKIPVTEEPGGLRLGSHRVGHD